MQSRIYLPKNDFAPGTILEYLIAQFPQIAAQTWEERIARGLVAVDAEDELVTRESPYRHGVTVLYYKEVPDEPLPVEDGTILYRDAEILVADKPHGMVVTPAGDHVKRSLLFRIQQSTGLAALAPMHRLDRETAGVVLFAIREETRGRYHQLFMDRTVEREYLAIAHLGASTDQKSWEVKNRMEGGEPWFRQRIVENSGGEPNAITQIEYIETRNGLGLFRIRPQTGKKHQIRVHMASIGFPIVGDLLYPEIRERQENDPPLQLLAHRLSFVDPLSGESRSFISGRTME